MSATLPEQIACVKRELALRERNYPKWVASGRMKQGESDREIERMRAVLDSLERFAAFSLAT